MSTMTEGIGLREAARRYSVELSTIQYWIKQGWVRVLRAPEGPGKSMQLDEVSLLDALSAHRPHTDGGVDSQGTKFGKVGLREASRKYHVDIQTIRTWINESKVSVLQEATGPGKAMILDEETVMAAVENHTFKRNRMEVHLEGSSTGGAPPVGTSPATGGWGPRKSWRAGLVAAVVGALLLVVMMLPATVAGLAVSLSAAESTVLVGERVDITSSVSFTHPEGATVTDGGVTLAISGPQALSVPLPAKSGAFSNTDIATYPKYSSDPDGTGPIAVNDPIGTISGTVTHVNWRFHPGFAYGYGYGYGYTQGANSSIGYDINYYPPTKLFPAPSALTAEYTSSPKLFDAPGGGGGVTADINVSYAFGVGMIPGAPPGSPIVDVAFSPTYNQVVVLVKGMGKYIAAELDPTYGYVNYHLDAAMGAKKALGLAIVTEYGGDTMFVVEWDNLGGSVTHTIKNLYDYSDSTLISVAGAGPTGDVTGFFYNPNNSSFYTVEEQTSSTGQITIWKTDRNSGVTTNFQVSAQSTGGGYNGIGLIDSTAFLGVYGDQAAQIDFISNSVVNDYAIVNPGGDFNATGVTIDSNNNLIYLTNGIDNGIYTASPPGAVVASTTDPTGIAYTTGSSTATSFVLSDSGGAIADYITEIKHASTAGDVVSITGGFARSGLSNTVGFHAPTNNVAALAYLHPYLYTVDNNGSGSPVQYGLYKIDTTNSTSIAATENETSSGSGVWGGWTKVATLSKSTGTIGGMVVAGGKLYLGEDNSKNIHIVQADGTSEGAFLMLDQGGMMAPSGTSSLAYVASADNWETKNIFIVGQYNEFYQIEADASPASGNYQGSMIKKHYTSAGSPPYYMTGMTSTGGLVYALDSDTGALYKGSLPGRPDPEITTAGSYSAQLSVVTTSPSATTTSSAASWTSAKVTALTLAISEPLPNQGYKASDLTSGKVTIEGTVNDPTVTNIAVLADLPSATLIGYDAGDGKEASTFTATADKAQYAMSGLWHFTTTADAAIHDTFSPQIQSHNFLSGTYAYYGANETGTASTSKPNYCKSMPGMPAPPGGQTACMIPDFMQDVSSGSFDTPAVTISADGDASLNFDVWWEVETAADWDNLKLQSCTGTPGSSSASCTNLAQFAATQDLPGGFSAGAILPCAGMGYPACSYVPSLIVLPSGSAGSSPLTSVAFPIPSSVTGSVFFRFNFDSVDPYANHFTGILLDNIEVAGAGSIALASATVDKSTSPPSWTLLMKPEEGENAVTISATHNAYVTGGLSASANATFFLDTNAPTLTMAVMADVTATSSLTVSGTFVEAQPKVIEIYNTIGSGKANSVGKITSFTAGQTAFSKVVTLSEGSNKIEVRIKDKSSQCNTTTSDDCTTTISDNDTVVLDTTAPVLTAGETAYPVGFVSARQGDLGVFQADCTDAAGFGIQHVKMASPVTPTVFDMIFRTDIPGAVQDQWLSGIVGGSAAAKNFLMPMTVPTSVAPGTLSMNIRCTDTAGNTTDAVVQGTIASTLGGFVINLMPGDNIVSLPIIPTAANSSTLETSINTLVAGVVSPVDGAQAIEKILYYDANDTTANSADRWSVWTASTSDTDSLTVMKPGRGYIFQMRASAFKASASIAAGVPATQAPIALRYTGSFLKGGQSIPPVYTIEGKDATNNPAGGTWNLIGLHSEDAELVSNYFQPLESPARIWGSALVYQNKIDFPLSRSEAPTVILGAFSGLVSTDYIQPGQGMWVFALADGTLVPR